MSFIPFRRTAFRALAGIVIALMGMASAGSAQTTATWGGGNGNWGDNNWSPSGVPDGANFNVNLDGGNVTGSAVTLNQYVTLGRLTIDAGDSLIVNPGYAITLASGGFAESGAMNLNGTLSYSSGSLLLGNGNNQSLTLNGSGNLLTSNTLVYSNFTGTTFTNNAHISGTGILYGDYNNMHIINNGTITGSGGILLINSNFSNGLSNNGTISAAANSTVSLSSGRFYNAGQMMKADGTNAFLDLAGATDVRGGTLAGLNGGQARITNGSVVLNGLDSGALTLQGSVSIANSIAPTFRGAITNNGTLTVGASSSFMVGNGSNESVTLGGSGNLVLNGAFIYSNFSGTTFTNNVGISGTGTIYGDYLDVVNNGTINGSGGTLNINSNSGNGLINNGTISAAANSIVSLSNGKFHNAGQMMKADGTNAFLDLAGATNLRGGTLAGINGGQVRITNGSVILNGLDNGALTLQGNVAISGGIAPTIRGTIHNNGNITTGTNSIFAVGSAHNESATLGGYGMTTFDNGYIWSNYTGVTFSNGFGHTLQNVGTIGWLDKVNNDGVLQRSVSGTTTIAPTSEFNNGYYGSLFAFNSGNINISSGIVKNLGQFVAYANSSINLTGSATMSPESYSAGTLTGGTYYIADNGQLNLGIGNINTLKASVYLFGATADFSPVHTVTTIDNGHLSIGGGKSFSTISGLSLVNAGGVSVGSGSTFSVAGALNNQGAIYVRDGGMLDATTGNLMQYDSPNHALTGGDYQIAGTFKYSGGAIHRIEGGRLILDGPNAQFMKSDNTSAVSGLGSVGSNGQFAIQGGAVFSGPSSFSNEGYVNVGGWSGSGVLFLPGSYIQSSGSTTLENGTITAGGNIEIEGGTLRGSGLLQPGGTTPTVLVNGVLTPFGWSPGNLEVEGRLGLATGSEYAWYFDPWNLKDNASGVAGVDWDLIAARDGVFGGNVALSIGYIYAVDNSNPFWQTDHEWDILIAEAGGIGASFSLLNQNPSSGFFSLSTITSGAQSTLRLIYTAQAVPEPLAAPLFVVGVGMLSVLRRKRRRSLPKT